MTVGVLADVLTRAITKHGVDMLTFPDGETVVLADILVALGDASARDAEIARLRGSLDGPREEMKAKRDHYRQRCEQLEAALRKIEAWEMPLTGKFWENDPTRPMSYSACWGSNGERDVIREIARAALETKP